MNIYLVASPSRNLINDEIKKIIKGERNVIYMDYLNNGLDLILEEAGYLSLFDEKKYLIIKNANIFGTIKSKEEDLSKLESYLIKPNPNTVLILTLTEKLDERKKITKIIKEKYNLKTIPNLSPQELITKIIDVLKKNNLQIDYNNAKYIAEVSLNNYDLVVNELEKIILYYDADSVIDGSVLKYLISRNTQDNIFKFTEAVISKNNKMFTLFNDLKLIKEEPVYLISALAREYRLSYKSLVLYQKGFSRAKIAGELGLANWMVEKYLKNALGYRGEELLGKIKALSEVDIAIKKGAIDKYLAIEMFLLDI